MTNPPQIKAAPATTDLHLHANGGCTGFDEASASTSMGEEVSWCRPKIDAGRGDGASSSTLKKMKQPRWVGNGEKEKF